MWLWYLFCKTCIRILNLIYVGIKSDVIVRPEKFQFLEKGQNRNFGYKIVISVKNSKFILWISDDETDFTVGIVS